MAETFWREPTPMKKIFFAALMASLAAGTATADVTNTLTNTETKKDIPIMTANVVITTSLGTIKAELYPDKAPTTVSNFLAYVDEGFYNGTIFHRVIPNFMVQGGGFTPNMSQKATKAQIKNEAANGLKNDRGTLAMARTAVVDSATCQFFINHKNNDFLNYQSATPQGFGYCVFGKVTEGLDVVDKIAAVKTGMNDVPQTTVTILSITRDAK